MNSAKVKSRLQKKADEFFTEVNEIAGEVFDDVVKPYLIENNYSFYAGMGGWSVFDCDGEMVDKLTIPNSILNLLETSVPLYDYELGSCMSDFDPKD